MRILSGRALLAVLFLLGLSLSALPARADDGLDGSVPAAPAAPAAPLTDETLPKANPPSEVLFHPTLLLVNWWQLQPVIDANNTNEPIRIRRTELGGFLDVPGMTFRFNVDLAKGPTPGNPSDLEEAFVNIPLKGDVHLFAGQFKTPMSLSALQANGEIPLTERPLAVNNIGLNFEQGIMFQKQTDHVEMEVGGFAGSGPGILDTAGRLMFHPNPNLQFGGSIYQGHEAFNLANNRWALESSFTPGKWLFQAEYLEGSLGSVTRRGWYLTAGRTLRPNLEGMMRYEEFNPDITNGATAEHDYTVGLNWNVRPPQETIQINYVFKNGQNLATPNDFRVNFQYWIK